MLLSILLSIIKGLGLFSLGGQLLENNILVGVDADIGGDLHCLVGDLFRRERSIEQRERRRLGVIAARADADHALLRL